jgi:hypothetical protein
MILGHVISLLLILLKIIILVIVGIYFGLKRITPSFPLWKKFTKNKFVKYLHKVLPRSKPKINLVFDLDGTLIKSSKSFIKEHKQI